MSLAVTTSVSREAQDFERAWWAGCENTFGEEAKQITYAYRMGLVNEPREGKWPVYDLQGRSVLDLGGGPVSMLLKTVNGGRRTVVDPCPFPDWVGVRYEEAGISVFQANAERWVTRFSYDEAYCYNVLQHTIDPHEVIETAKRHASVLRIFEWLETEPNVGHPHTLHADELNEWIGSPGEVGFVDENGAYGLAYWGVMEL